MGLCRARSEHNSNHTLVTVGRRRILDHWQGRFRKVDLCQALDRPERDFYTPTSLGWRELSSVCQFFLLELRLTLTEVSRRIAKDVDISNPSGVSKSRQLDML